MGLATEMSPNLKLPAPQKRYILAANSTNETVWSLVRSLAHEETRISMRRHFLAENMTLTLSLLPPFVFGKQLGFGLLFRVQMYLGLTELNAFLLEKTHDLIQPYNHANTINTDQSTLKLTLHPTNTDTDNTLTQRDDIN